MTHRPPLFPLIRHRPGWTGRGVLTLLVLLSLPGTLARGEDTGRAAADDPSEQRPTTPREQRPTRLIRVTA